MAKDPSLSERPRGTGEAGRRGGEARREDAAAPGSGRGGAGDADPVGGASGDPWAEADAPRPDENAMDSLDQHPQPEDEPKRHPGA
jgi:hypothetical protein